MDFVRPTRPVPMALVAGRGHYDAVVQAVLEARVSVWIATANLKELMVEDHRARPGRARTMRSKAYRSVLAAFDELSGRGVELRLLHAGPPSRPFRAELSRRPRVKKLLGLRQCPRVHAKLVIVDGALAYLGSANWTGAGLGAKGSGRRNFELGVLSSDEGFLDDVQAYYERLWRGGECAGCKLKEECPGPLAELEARCKMPPGEPSRGR